MLFLIRSLAWFLFLMVPCLVQGQTRSIGFNTKILEEIIGVKGKQVEFVPSVNLKTGVHFG